MVDRLKEEEIKEIVEEVAEAAEKVPTIVVIEEEEDLEIPEIEPIVKVVENEDSDFNRDNREFNEQLDSQISSETVKELEEDREIENLKKIEAALFLSARYLNLQQLVMLTDINPLMLKELLGKLIDRYNHENSAVEIISKKNMWKMDVRQEYVNMINKLATGSSEFTKAEQETLAVIAYKQPVKQSVIIKIRGNKAYEHIKHFREIGLVKAKRAGHTWELTLSEEFYDYFHLEPKEKESESKVEEQQK